MMPAHLLHSACHPTPLHRFQLRQSAHRPQMPLLQLHRSVATRLQTRRRCNGCLSQNWQLTGCALVLKLLACCLALPAWADGILPLSAHNKRVTTTAVASMEPQPDCNSAIANALQRQHNGNERPAVQPPSDPCLRHPWVNLLEQWNQQGMSAEIAMQWLVTDPEDHLWPLLTGDMADIARMRAAHALATAGHLSDARHLWSGLMVKRPHWPEVRFNLALSDWLAGHVEMARQHLTVVQSLCERKGCDIPASLLHAWMHRIDEVR